MRIPETEPLLQDIRLEHYPKRLVVRSGIPLHTLSSAICCGGLQQGVRSILNLTVDKGYNGSDPAEELRRETAALGLPGKTVGLMTAVDVKHAVVAAESVVISDSGTLTGRTVISAKFCGTGTSSGSALTGCAPAESARPEGAASGGTSPGCTLLESVPPENALTVVAIVTAGISNAWRAGAWPTFLGQKQADDANPYPPGTINTIVLIEGKMTDAAMVNAVITATEAKTAVFGERGVRCPKSGKTATGTTTDAVVIAATGRGAGLEYAGPGTFVGALIARTVTKALCQALEIGERQR